MFVCLELIQKHQYLLTKTYLYNAMLCSANTWSAFFWRGFHVRFVVSRNTKKNIGNFWHHCDRNFSKHFKMKPFFHWSQWMYGLMHQTTLIEVIRLRNSMSNLTFPQNFRLFSLLLRKGEYIFANQFIVNEML